MDVQDQKAVIEVMSNLHERVKTGCLCFEEGKCSPGKFIMSSISQMSEYNDYDYLLMICSLLEEICNLYTIQHTSGHICSALVGLIKNELNESVYDHLVELLASDGQYISFAAMKSLLGLLKAECLSSGNLHQLGEFCRKLTTSFLPLDKKFVNKISVLEHLLIDFKNFNRMVVPIQGNPINCHLTEAIRVEMEALNVALICNILHSIISLPDLIRTLMLWSDESKVHSLNCILRILLIIFETPNKIKLAFLQDTSSLIGLLTAEMIPLVWERTCSLLRDVLDYKSTASMTTDESKMNLAYILLNLEKSKLWTRIPHSVGFHGFGGPFSLNETDPSRELSSLADKPVLQSFLLCYLACLATFCKAGRHINHIQDTTIQNSIISIREFIRFKVRPCLDNQKRTLNDTLSSLLLFDDQDDALVEALLYFLDVSSHLDELEILKNDTDSHFWNPHHHFFIFLLIVNMDYEVLLDLLISEETYFLLYFLKYLKLIVSNYDSFTNAHQTEEMSAYLGRNFTSTCFKNGKRAHNDNKEKLVDYELSSEESEEETCYASTSNTDENLLHPNDVETDSFLTVGAALESTNENTLFLVINVFSRLLDTIKKQLAKNLFPYNAKPLVKLLENIKMNYRQ